MFFIYFFFIKSLLDKRNPSFDLIPNTWTCSTNPEGMKNLINLFFSLFICVVLFTELYVIPWELEISHWSAKFHHCDINELVIKMIIGFMSKTTALQLHYTVAFWYISLMSAAWIRLETSLCDFLWMTWTHKVIWWVNLSWQMIGNLTKMFVNQWITWSRHEGHFPIVTG